MYGRTEWTEDQRAHLESLEKVEKPTDMQRGELTALTLTTTRTEERSRAARLRDRWGARR